MLQLGLSTADHRTYLKTLASSHTIKVTVQILTPEHAVVRTVSHTLMDGQIDVIAPTLAKGEIEVSRQARLTFLDPGSTLALDSGSPADGAYYMDRMLRVIYSVLCPFGWVDVPVFTGPIDKVDRDDDLINVEALGMERYALGYAWDTATEKGRLGDVMTALMKRTGEITRYMDFPDTSHTVSKPVSVSRSSHIWAHVWRVNSSMNRILFYDGRGVCRSTPRPEKIAANLTTGPGGMITAPPQISYSIEDLINACRVVGSKAHKAKHTPWAEYLPPQSNRLSPWSLGRRDKPLYLAEFVDNADLKSTAQCRAVAKQTVIDSMVQHTDAPVECLPIPHLEPWDLLQVTTNDVSARIRATEFSLPLVQRAGAGTPMTIQSRRNLRKPSRRVRRA